MEHDSTAGQDTTPLRIAPPPAPAGPPARPAKRRAAVRVGVPVAVAAVVAVGIGLPALASDEAPDLPAISAQDLVAKALAADTDTFSGTVRVSADLGLPTALTDALGGSGPVAGLARSAGARVGSADPQLKAVELLGGAHTLTVASDGPDRQKLTLTGEKSSGYEFVHNGDQLWAYDRGSQQALHLTAPEGAADGHRAAGPGLASVTPQEVAKRFLERSAATTAVTVSGTERVAGHAAYRLSIKPKQSGSTIDEIRVAVDAEKGVPLAVQVRTVDGATAFDVRFGSLSYAKPDAATFQFTAPKGAEVTEAPADGLSDGPLSSVLPEFDAAAAGPADPAANAVIGEGWTTVLHGEAGAEAAKGLAKFTGRHVDGGTLVSTRIVNALITDDGRVYLGAVTAETLQKAAKG
ncbi:outer membrane lipoprotein carrier protein LolA [Kitasatospora phosalacinea]|uniref:Outer membrane lipoprotein carrier protein LolA n=1 Tax=Kitasatospora phosalacinea TaxID=2065 RepID=A0ABW6GCM0_9ACTN